MAYAIRKKDRHCISAGCQGDRSPFIAGVVHSTSQPFKIRFPKPHTAIEKACKKEGNCQKIITVHACLDTINSSES